MNTKTKTKTWLKQKAKTKAGLFTELGLTMVPNNSDNYHTSIAYSYT